MILWFSGTGNSRLVARELSSILQEPMCEMHEGMAVSASRIVWVFPIYSWGVPWFVRRVMRSAKIGKGALCHMVATCGDDADLAGEMWRKEAENAGMTPLVTATVQMPNNYVCMKGFDVDAQDIAAEKLANMPARVGEVCRLIEAGQPVDATVHGRFAWVKTRIVYPWFVKYKMTPKYFRATEACVGCGKCVKECPLKNYYCPLNFEGIPQN